MEEREVREKQEQWGGELNRVGGVGGERRGEDIGRIEEIRRMESIGGAGSVGRFNSL